MRIRFKKGNNHDTLTCLREDGTSTWATARPGRLEHDLVHYAVETTLGYDRAFYGAIARGRALQALSAFDAQVGRKRRPTRQAHHAEHLVSLLANGFPPGLWGVPATGESEICPYRRFEITGNVVVFVLPESRLTPRFNPYRRRDPEPGFHDRAE